jgi:aminopeptidase N
MDESEEQSATEAMASDALQTTRPIRTQAETSAQINELFDAIAYNKTAAMLRMVESYISPDVFRAGINRYLKAHEYANATAEDFMSAMAAASNKPVDRIMQSYIMQPGIPYLAVAAQCTAGKTQLAVTQQRFYIDQALMSKPSNEQWTVPVCVSVAGHERSCDLLTQKKQTLTYPGCGEAVFTNPDGKGYYRSGYESEAVAKLAPQAESRLDAPGRIYLLDNEWAMARGSAQRINIALNVMDAMKNDPSAAIADDISMDLRYLTDKIITGTDRPAFEAWVRQSLQPAMQQLGYAAKPTDTPEQRERRADIFETLGYSGRDPQALQEAMRLVNQYMQNPDSVDPTMVDPAFSLAAIQGNAQLYNQFLAHLKAANSPEDYFRYLLSLAEFRQPDLVQRTLELAISPQVRSQDAPFLIGLDLRNPAGQQEAWNWLKTNWQLVVHKTSIWGAAGLVRATSAFCSPEMEPQVQSFFSQHPLPAAQRGLKQALESINSCINFRSHQGTNLANWLKTNGATATASVGQ